MENNPRQNIIASIEKQVDLFQTTAGKSNANTISVAATILNSMGQTILAQFDEITKLNGLVATLEKGNAELRKKKDDAKEK
jgi:hypothetical protein